MAKTKTLSLDAAQQEVSSSVWIVNTSKPVGQIMIEVFDGAGGKTVVVIPVTWIPIDATMHTPKDALLRSPEFRKLQMQGMLSIISAKDAAEVLKRPDAKREQEVVLHVLQSVNDLEISATRPASEAIEDLVEDTLNPIVQSLIGEIDNISEQQALSMVRGRVSELTRRDLQALANKCPMRDVKAWAAERTIEMDSENA